MKQHIIFFTGVLFVFFGLRASALQQEFNVNEGAHLLISSEEATITLTGGTQSSLKVIIDPASEAYLDVVTSSESGGGEFIQIRDKISRPKIHSNGKLTESKFDVKNHVKIEISGHSIPSEIHLREGQVTVQKWQKEFYVHVQKGKILSRENANLLVVHMQKGEVTVTDHQGKLIIDNFQANTSLKEIKGDVELQSFMGDLTMEKLNGSISVNANHGSIKVLRGTGSLQFELQKATLTSTQFEGRVEGQSQEGSINIQAGKEPDIIVKSQAGKINISTMLNSGALLNLSSSEGDVIVPSYLKVSRDGSVRSLRGRLKGELQKGSIFVRSSEGNIVVK